MNDHDLIDETALRRALRFEADETIPRFDVAAIAAAARETRPATRTLVLSLAVSVITGVVAGTVWSALFALAPEVGAAAVETLLDALVAVATFVEPVAEVAAQPAVPISLLAALALAILYERRERAHVHAS